MMSLCLSCANAHIAIVPVKRRTGDPTMTTQVKSMVCSVDEKMFARLKDKLPANHSFIDTEGFVTIAECNKYDKSEHIFKFTAVKPEKLADIGNTHINSEEMNNLAQWKRILHLLEQSGYTIVHRKME